jgi:hypothetical protein
LHKEGAGRELAKRIRDYPERNKHPDEENKNADREEMMNSGM